jgi:hypothetical protein
MARFADDPIEFTALTNEHADGLAVFRIKHLSDQTGPVSAPLAGGSVIVEFYGQESHVCPRCTRRNDRVFGTCFIADCPAWNEGCWR